MALSDSVCHQSQQRLLSRRQLSRSVMSSGDIQRKRDGDEKEEEVEEDVERMAWSHGKALFV